MKITLKILSTLLVIGVFCSCSIQKRQHLKGFHISRHSAYRSAGTVRPPLPEPVVAAHRATADTPKIVTCEPESTAMSPHTATPVVSQKRPELNFTAEKSRETLFQKATDVPKNFVIPLQGLSVKRVPVCGISRETDRRSSEDNLWIILFQALGFMLLCLVILTAVIALILAFVPEPAAPYVLLGILAVLLIVATALS